MKVVQFLVDVKLLKQIDLQPETQRYGRSAFLRLAAREVLRRRRDIDIDASYKRAYQRHPPEKDEFFTTQSEQAWPEA